MVKNKKPFSSTIYVLIICFLQAWAQNPSSQNGKDATLPVPEILGKIVERAQFEKEQKHEEQFFATRHSISDSYNAKGEVTEHNDRLMKPFLMEGKVFYRVMEKDGKPLTDEEKKKQVEREGKIRERLKQPTKPAKKDNEDFEVDDELLSRFQFTLIGQEDVNGHKAYVLAFLPKTNVKLPEKRMIDKVVNRLTGKIWVDTKYFAFTKLDLHLTEPTSFFVGLGNLRALDMTLTQIEVVPGIFQDVEQNMFIEARQLFKTTRMKSHNVASNYKKKSDLTEAPLLQ